MRPISSSGPPGSLLVATATASTPRVCIGALSGRYSTVLPGSVWVPVPAGWLTSEDGTAISFEDLTPRQADRLVHALEELFARLPELPPVRHSELDQTLPVEFGIPVPSLDLSEVL